MFKHYPEHRKGLKDPTEHIKQVMLEFHT